MSDDAQSMVIYSDGSCKPNPGFIGFGIHGYTYKNEVPKKNYGGKGYRLTSYGYDTKESQEENPSVTPLIVFDGYGSFADSASNNAAEVHGVKEALKLGLEYPIKKLLIKTDSQYALRGYMEWLDSWNKNNWLSREGRQIANVNSWKEIYDLRNQYQSKGVEVNIEWVKGHVGLPGNEKADKLANIGRINSEANNTGVKIYTHKGDEYWSRNLIAEKHPLISKPWMYMRGLLQSHLPGEYYFGNIGKDEDFLGKRDANGGYAIVQLKKPDTALDMIRNIQSRQGGDNNIIYTVSLRSLYNSDHLNDLIEYGDSILIRANPRRKDLFFIDSILEAQKTSNNKKPVSDEEKEDEEIARVMQDDDDSEEVSNTDPLTREQSPQKLAARVFDCLTVMKEKLEDYKSGNNRFNQYYDITGEFYTIETKMVKKQSVTQHKLKPEFKVGVMQHDLNINYDGQDIPIRLTLTIDAPDRNTLKRLESLNPKLTLIVWKESEITIRYSVVVECVDAVSIWSGFYSNLIFLPAKKH